MIGESLKSGFCKFSVLLSRAGGDRFHGAPGIFAYHGVLPRVPGRRLCAGDTTPERLRENIVGLRRRGYEIVPLREMLAAHAAGAALPPQRVALTFDDGFHSVLRYGLPVLRELSAPATVFVATAYLGSDMPFPFDPWGRRYWRELPSALWRPLSVAECCELSDSGLVELGVHTHTHQDFRNRPAEFLRDMQTSVETLRARFGVEQPAFAFPWGKRAAGYAGGALTEAARQAGVSCALSTECRCVDLDNDPFTWGRFAVCWWDDSASLAAKLRGWYGWGPALTARLTGWRARKKAASPANRRAAAQHSQATTVGT